MGSFQFLARTVSSIWPRQGDPDGHGPKQVPSVSSASPLFAQDSNFQDLRPATLHLLSWCLASKRKGSGRLDPCQVGGTLYQSTEGSAQPSMTAPAHLLLSEPEEGKSLLPLKYKLVFKEWGLRLPWGGGRLGVWWPGLLFPWGGGTPGV